MPGLPPMGAATLFDMHTVVSSRRWFTANLSAQVESPFLRVFLNHASGYEPVSTSWITCRRKKFRGL